MYKHNTHKIAQAHIHTTTQTGQIILIKQLTYYSQLDYTTTEQRQQTIKLMRQIIVLTRVLDIYELKSIRNPETETEALQMELRVLFTIHYTIIRIAFEYNDSEISLAKVSQLDEINMPFHVFL